MVEQDPTDDVVVVKTSVETPKAESCKPATFGDGSRAKYEGAYSSG